MPGISEIDKITNEFCKAKSKPIDYTRIIEALKDMKDGCSIDGGTKLPILLGKDKRYLYIRRGLFCYRLDAKKQDAEDSGWKA